MILQPTLLSHPKFRIYKQALGRPDALEYLVRIWGHCQSQRKAENWGKVPPEYVEAIAEWSGKPGKLWSALVAPYCGKPGWIHVNEGGEIIITDWLQHNRQLVQKWNARTKTDQPSTDKPSGASSDVSTDKPSDQSSGVSSTALTGSDRTGGDQKGGEGVPPPPLSSSVPSEEEVRKAAVAAGIPAEYGARYWRKKQEKPGQWHDAQTGQLIHWQQQMANWWAEDRHKFPEQSKKSGGVHGLTKAELETQLSRTDLSPAERAILREQYRNLP